MTAIIGDGLKAEIFGRTSLPNLTAATTSAIQNQKLQTILLVLKTAQMLSAR